MANQPQIQVHGLRETQAAIRRAGDEDAKAAIRDAHLEGAELVEAATRPLIHVESGLLLGTLRATASQRSGRVAAGRKSVPYAGPHHFGWNARNIPPNPFLYDALDTRRDEVLQTFEDRMHDVAARVGALT